MNVAYIISMKGGMSAWNYREIDILIKNGLNIYIYPTKSEKGAYNPNNDWYTYEVSKYKAILLQVIAFLRYPFVYLRLFAIAAKTKTVPEFLLANAFVLNMVKFSLDHIHCHFGDSKLFTGYYCSKILGLPLTVTIHAYEILCNPNPEMFRIATNHCSKIVTVSDFNKQEIIRLFDIPEDKIEVIHIHGDMSDERMQTSVKLLNVAMFTEKKGHEILLKAIKKLNRKDITLWLVGDGPIDVKKMAKEMELEDITVFFGIVNEKILKVLYEACDIFVLPSRTASNGDREGIPVSIMEAMSFRKPVISTRHVGIPELIKEVLVDENDVDGLSEAIAYLIDHPETREKQGQANFQRIKMEYSDDAVHQLKQVFIN